MRYCVAERSQPTAGARYPDSAIHASPLLILIELETSFVEPRRVYKVVVLRVSLRRCLVLPLDL